MSDREGKIIIIHDRINDLKKDDRIAILRLLHDETPDKVQQKGGGCQIRFDNISDDLLTSIFDMVKKLISL